jgi:hypothetical protein
MKPAEIGNYCFYIATELANSKHVLVLLHVLTAKAYANATELAG